LEILLKKNKQFWYSESGDSAPDLFPPGIRQGNIMLHVYVLDNNPFSIHDCHSSSGQTDRS
jgi:hypothetical protein